MIYVIKGSEELAIRKQIDKICQGEDLDIVRISGDDEFLIDEIIDACNGKSLFASKSIVLVKDPYFLINKVDENKLEKFYKYLENPAYDSDLVLYSLEDKINTKLKAYKKVIENAELFNFEEYDRKQFNSFAYYELNASKLDINKEAVYLLIDICRNDSSLFMQNIEVLKNYPGKIDSDVINKLCTASDEINSFDLINAITDNDLDKAINLERTMLENSDDGILGIISLLAGQLRFLYQFSYLLSKNYDKKAILDEMKTSDYRYSKSLETIKKLKMPQILEMLKSLSDLDIACKSDFSLKDSSKFELLIIQLLMKREYARN